MIINKIRASNIGTKNSFLFTISEHIFPNQTNYNNLKQLNNLKQSNLTGIGRYSKFIIFIWFKPSKSKGRGI